jgi:hypothetical protein
LGLVTSVRWIVAIIASLLASARADAANIELKRLDAGNAVILIAGDLELGDIEQFHNKVANISKATVAFQSDGGSLLAGIRIGTLIRSKNYVTIVPDRAQCASACAVAWLGGVQRFMGTGARVGFHAAYVIKAGNTSESGPGNAVLGAYLNQLGLREEAIIYITQAAPNSMRWLSMEEAGQHGIDVALLPPPDLGLPPVAATIAPQQQPAHADLEQRATTFVLALAARWSTPNAEALHSLDQLYAENVLYNGKSTRRQAVLVDKRRLAERWPQRSYKVRPGSVSTTCIDDANLCRVHMMVDWEHQNAATAARAHGSASFEYSVALSGGTPRIAAETSALKDAPPASSSDGSAKQTLQRLLAQLTRLRQPHAPAKADAIRPSTPVPH